MHKWCTNGSETPKVQLLALTGIGFTPTFVWATDGRLAAAVRVHRAGLPAADRGGLGDPTATALEARQKQAEADALVDLQQRLAHPLAGTTADPQRARLRQRARDARRRPPDV